MVTDTRKKKEERKKNKEKKEKKMEKILTNDLFRLEYLANIFSKMNKVCLLLEGKELTVFVASDFSQKS